MTAAFVTAAVVFLVLDFLDGSARRGHRLGAVVAGLLVAYVLVRLAAGP